MTPSNRFAFAFLLWPFSNSSRARAQIMALVASFVATHVYFASLEEPEDAIIDQGHAWTLVGALSGAWTLCFIATLLLMKSGHKHSFFSTQTGHAWVKNFFVKGATDSWKSRTLASNKKQWKSIRGDVKAWCLENWERWEEEEPDWFSEGWRGMVDDDMIPPDCLRKMNGGDSARRRSRLGDVLGIGDGGGGGRGGAVVPVSSP